MSEMYSWLYERFATAEKVLRSYLDGRLQNCEGVGETEFGDLLGAAQDGGEDGSDACMEAMFDVYQSFA
jgi:hypothetical protein